MHVLHRLVDAGNTVVLIEHHLDLIKNADWIIDLGPGAGERGGGLVAEGTPEFIASAHASVTGQYLRNVPGVRPDPTSPGRTGGGKVKKAVLKQRPAESWSLPERPSELEGARAPGISPNGTSSGGRHSRWRRRSRSGRR
jgi:hypothetical protein